MPAATILGGISIGLQGLGMISDCIGGDKAAKAAKRAAKAEARAENTLTIERLRQLDKEERTMAGETRAATAASGVQVGRDSPLLLMAEQAREFAYEKRITREVGATKAASAMQRGRNVGNAVRYQSYSNLARGASNIFSIMHSSGMFSKGGVDPLLGKWEDI